MSLIDAKDTWLLLFVMVATVVCSMWLESKYKWAAKMTALVLVLLLAIVFSNLSFIPAKAPLYDFVWDYLLPFALPMLLFQTDIRKICRESGQLLIAFLIGAAGTVVGAFVSGMMFQSTICEMPGLAAMMTGTYIGGSVNFAVLGSAFHVSEDMVSAATIADNLNMAVYFFVLLSIPVKASAEDTQKVQDQGKQTIKANKGTLVRSAVIGLMLSAVVVAASDYMSGIWGNRYFWITTISVMIATIFPKQLGQLVGLQNVGTFMIYCFMFVIGAPASILEVIRNSPFLLLFAMVIVVCNMLFTFVIGSIFHMDRKIMIIASNANVGGPTTAASMAIAKGWNELVGPSLLVGCLGYVIGNYLGMFVGNMLM